MNKLNVNTPVLRTLVACAAVLAASGCAMHEQTRLGAGPAPAAAVVRVPAADLAFASTAGGNDMFEIQASQLALQRSQDAQVRAYAQMLVDHHRSSSNELLALLRTKGVTLAPAVPAPMQAQLQQMSGLAGDAFDRAYIRMAGLDAHATAITLFEQASRTLADPEMRAFAAKALPVLRLHRQSAERIAGTMAG